MINSIMFTFYRVFMYVGNSASSETWYWSYSNFQLSNRNIKYEYGDSYVMMIAGEFFLRFFIFFSLFVSFGFISIVNALMLRVILKSSHLVLLCLTMAEDSCAARYRINFRRRRIIYRQMAMTGAHAAYHDRFRMSKRGLFFTLSCLLSLNYGFWIACQEFSSKTSFNSIYSLMPRQYFLLVEVVEILNYIFVRTRTTIKYLPKFITITHMTFLMYVNSHVYPAQLEAIGALVWSNILIFALFIWKYEMPA